MERFNFNLKRHFQSKNAYEYLALFLIGGLISFAIVHQVTYTSSNETVNQQVSLAKHRRLGKTLQPEVSKDHYETAKKHFKKKSEHKEVIKKENLTTKTKKLKAKLWFLKNKHAYRYLDRTNLPLFHSEDPKADRIMNQLMYVPPDYDENLPLEKYKTIYKVKGAMSSSMGPSPFENCPVKTCTFVEDSMADIAITNYHMFNKTHPNQLLLLFIYESPARPSWEFDYIYYPNASIDLTSTFSYDSDIPSPYGKFIHYNENILGVDQEKNYAETKTKKAAWFASNCNDTTNKRTKLVKTLQKYIDVDMYGPCGNLTCKKGDDTCFEYLRKDYKFYLAFENSNCDDYITEKLFKNCLQNDILPVVMGAKKEQYERVAPHNSFIHIDDFESVEHLGKYLNLVDQDDTLYNSYFRWKGTGELFSGILYFENNVHYWCRLCAVLNSPQIHQPNKFALYEKRFIDWWDPEKRCRKIKTKIH